MRGRALGHVSGGFATLALGTVWAVAFAPWPDDWDGLGFLASIARFDLASFSPHPPGYPVYVGLLKVASVALATPIDAARAVAVVAGLVAIGGLAELLDASPAAGGPSWLGAVAVSATPLVFHAFTGVGTEAPALACAALAAVGLTSSRRGPGERALLVGVGVGLGLGVRISWAPFYLPLVVLLPGPLRLRALGIATLACLAWAVPVVALTGPSELVALARTHLGGHMTRWGGTAITEPSRGVFLVRDLLVDGFGGGSDPLGVATLLVLALATAAALHLWVARTSPSERHAHLSRGLILTAPYLAWVTFGQNLRQQPRHVLPLVAFAAYALARAALAPRPHPVRTVLFALLAALMVARTSRDAIARRTIPPPGEQLLAYLRAHTASSPRSTTAVFAGASGRFLDGTEWQANVHAGGSLGDALLAVARMDRLPRSVLVTSELAGLDAAPSTAVVRVASFCRPERLDRRLPCMDLYAVDPVAASR